jgi:phosphoadenosine phosphosulfate reductase
MKLDEIKNYVYWCQNCDIPLLTEKCYSCDSKGESSGVNFKPIFSEERKFLQDKLTNFFNKDIKLPKSLFFSKNRIIYKGETLFTLILKNGNLEFKKGSKVNHSGEDEQDIELQKYFDRVIKANLPVLEFLENESISFIKKIFKQFHDNKKFILFSGGKDSTITAWIVRKAVGKIPLFFSNTTLEFPETLKYIQNFANEYDFELFSEKPVNNFFEMCKVLDPPSHIMRWCCTVIKAYPVNKFMESMDGDILCFDGIRKAESTIRRDYPRIYKNKKINHQILARAIFHWPTLAVWLYIFKNNIIFNSVYRQGFNRIGCCICPYNSQYDEILMKYFYPKIVSHWKNILQNYAKKKNKGWDLKWVNEGYWKKRKPNKKRIISILEEENSKNLTVRYKYREGFINQKTLEFLKPFGKINFLNQNYFEINGKYPFKINGLLGGTHLRIKFENKIKINLKNQLKKQLEKSINCVNCGGCIGACPNNAITISNEFNIDERKCQSCLKCVNSRFTNYGCIALSFKEETKRIGEEDKLAPKLLLNYSFPTYEPKNKGNNGKLQRMLNHYFLGSFERT